jgi:F5/8 type C domain
MREALANAREDDAKCPPSRRGALKMARAHADVADALLNSEDEMALAPVLTLYREALLWLLAEDAASRRVLALAMDSAPESFLAEAAQDDVRMARLRHLLAMHAHLAPPDTSTQEQRRLAEMTRASVRAMLDQVSALEARNVRTILRRRRWRIGFAAGVLVAGFAALTGIGILLFTPTDLAQGKPWQTSSALSAVFTAKVMFHTNEEMNPWFEIDLVRPTAVHRLFVKNRADCCQERAVPLLIEVSLNRSNWQQVARRDSPFAFWEPSFSPVEARYVRLRVPRFTALHLEQVTVY